MTIIYDGGNFSAQGAYEAATAGTLAYPLGFALDIPPLPVLSLPGDWDLSIDGTGNIAMATGAYAIAQDVASALRTFAGELWYDTTQGVPYFTDALGQGVDVGLLTDDFDTAALIVPGVVQAETILNPLDRTSRLLTGTVNVIDTTGQALGITF